MARIIYPFQMSWIDYPSPSEQCISVFMVGCDNCCEQSQNQELQDYDIEKPNIVDVPDVDDLLYVLGLSSKKYMTNNVCLLGGDPLYDRNIEFTKEILSKDSSYNICIYTGHSIDYVKEHNVTGFSFIKTGKYNHSLHTDPHKTDDYIQLSSTNQELYDHKFNLLSLDGKYTF